jgi:hypothetical protein
MNSVIGFGLIKKSVGLIYNCKLIFLFYADIYLCDYLMIAFKKLFVNIIICYLVGLENKPSLPRDTAVNK